MTLRFSPCFNPRRCRISLDHPEALKAGAANGDLPGRETEQERVGMPKIGHSHDGSMVLVYDGKWGIWMVNGW